MHARKQLRALGRRGELDEDRHHVVPGGRLPVKVLPVATDPAHIHATLLGEGPGLFKSHWRKIKGVDRQALFGQPDAVAALAIGHRQCPAGPQVRCLLLQVLVGGLAKEVSVLRKALVPGVQGGLKSVHLASLWKSYIFAIAYFAGSAQREN